MNLNVTDLGLTKAKPVSASQSGLKVKILGLLVMGIGRVD
jgi:hypothetical protein